jgi:hypothetical protein
MIGMPPTPRATSIPKIMQPTFVAVTELSDAVCEEHLDHNYRDLARDMTATLCRKRPSPLSTGQPRTWACGIVYALGKTNFLSDKATQPSMVMADLCAAFGVSQSTASAKARAIMDALRIRVLDPAWTLPSLIDRNPLIWMAHVNGLLVDLRDMPREIQVFAYEQGAIPYVPADKDRG